MADEITPEMLKDELQNFLGVRWWALALRGVFAILFGVLAFVTPVTTVLALVIVFSVYAIADGIAGLFSSYGAARDGQRWVALAIEAVASIVIGVLALMWPQITVFVFLIIVAVKAGFTGALLIIAAIKLDGAHGRIWLVLAGLASLGFAVLLIAAPMSGALLLTWWLGLYAIFFGIVLIALGFVLRRFRNHLATA